MLNHQYVYKAKIINVVDGDTVDMIVDLGFYTFIKERFRLSHIDTPELNSPDAEERKKAVEAKNFMSQYNNQDVLIKSSKKDKYGRFLAEIYQLNSTTSINDSLVSNNLAKIWRP